MNTGAPTIRGTPVRALTGATIGFFVGFAAVSLFGPTAKLLKEAMDLTPFEVGLLVAAPSATGSILRIPFGAWVDTTGGRKPLTWLLLLSAMGLGGLLILLATRYPNGLMDGGYYALVLAMGMLAGCGIAAFSVGIGQVSYWYPETRQGRALAIYAGLGNLAPGLFALIIPVMIGMLGLSWTYAAWLMFLLIGVTVYAWLGCNAPFFQLWRGGEGEERVAAVQRARACGQELFPAGGAMHGLIRTIRLPRTWALIFLYFTSFGGFLALTAWLPTYWDERFTVSLSMAGAFTMAYSVLSSAIRVPGGYLADRFGGEQTALASFTVMGAGAVLVMSSTTLPVAVAGCMTMALGMGTANAAVFKLVPRYLASIGGGAGAGWVGGLGAFGGFVLPPLLGTFLELFGREQGYVLCFTLFAGLAVACCLVTVLLVRTAEVPAGIAAELESWQVICPLDNRPAEVVVQAISGEMPAGRLVRCSLLEAGETCEALCLEQVAAQKRALEETGNTAC